MLLWQQPRPSLQQSAMGEAVDHIQVCQPHSGALAQGHVPQWTFRSQSLPSRFATHCVQLVWDVPVCVCWSSYPQGRVFEARLLGWGLGKGTGVSCTRSSGKQETGRVVPPVHAKLRASGSFIHAIAKLAFDIYVSLRWSSVMRFHLKRSHIKGLNTRNHAWGHMHCRSRTGHPH